MNSILLIGNKSFTASVIAQVRGLDALTVTSVASPIGALPLMESVAPDVVITQASQLVEGSVLKTFNLERHSTYFVVIEESSYRAVEEAKFVLPFAEQYLEKTASAIESGADAYLLLPPQLPPAISAIETAVEIAMETEAAYNRSTLIESFQPQTCPPAGNTSHSQPPLKIADCVAIESQTDRTGQPMSALVFNPSQRRLIQAHIQMGLNRAQRFRDLARINDWLSAVALVDALTQISNRRAFDLELPRQIKVARMKETPLSIMVLDLDFFKSVNDRYGHLIGDDVLKLMAKRLLTNMRFYDTPFRYGGEEFVVTLSNTDLIEGRAIAERLRQSISREPFKLIDPTVEGTGQLNLTVSIGLAELRPDDDDQGRSLLHRADQRLLRAKSLGRDQVVSD